MKQKIKLIFLSIIICSLFLAARAYANARYTEDDIKILQNEREKKGARWTAGITSVSVLSHNQKQRLCGDVSEDIHDGDYLSLDSYPSSFDWRTEGGVDWTTPIKSQGGCGSCYIFGSIAIVEAQKNIVEADPNLNLDLSEQFILSCSSFGTCEGGYSSDVLEFVMTVGTTYEICFPYQADDSIPCSNACPSWQYNTVTIDSWNTIFPMTKENIIAHLLNGPITASIEVYEDFYYYTGGIYEHIYGRHEGSHLVSIVGYDDISEYWICKNSWGTDWGEDGWFRIKYGECDIESRHLEYVNMSAQETYFSIIAVLDSYNNPVYEGIFGDTIKVYGIGATESSDVNVYWDSVKDWDGEKGLLNSTLTEVDGSFEVCFDVPEAVNGDHYIWVKDTFTGEVILYDEPLNVLGRVILSPSYGLVGDNIDIYGYGFSDEEDVVSVTLNGDDLETSPTVLQTDELGSWTASFGVPIIENGDYEIVATDGQGVIATTYFKVGIPESFVNINSTWYGFNMEVDNDGLEPYLYNFETIIDGSTYPICIGQDIDPLFNKRYYRGHVQWNTSTIPDEADIVSVTLHIYAPSSSHSIIGDYVDSYECDMDFYQMSYKVSDYGRIQSECCGDDLFYDAYDGILYNWTFVYQDGEYYGINLGLQSVQDLQDQLTDDWFAIGFHEYTENNDGSGIDRGVSLYGGNYCSLYVTYTVPVVTKISNFSPLFINNDVKMIYPSENATKPLGCSAAMVSDWLASAFIYTKLESVTEGLDIDGIFVNQTSGRSEGENGTSIISFGGQFVNPVVKYAEGDGTPDADRAPVMFHEEDGTFHFQYKNGTNIPGAELPKSVINYDEDMFTIEVYEDGNSRYIMLCYGFGWKGTYAAGKYFDDAIYPNLKLYPFSWIIVKWEDTNGNWFVNTEADGDTYTIIATGF